VKEGLKEVREVIQGGGIVGKNAGGWNTTRKNKLKYT